MAKYTEVSPTLIEGYRQYCNLLIVTATPVEKDVLHQNLTPIDGQDAILKISKGQYTYYLGKFGNYNTVHVATANMGPSNRGSSIPTTMKAIENWKPKAVLMVGIAFGGDPKKIKIGDVLVSERVVNYETQKLVRGGQSENRSPEGPASSLLLDRFNTVDDWNYIVKYDDVEYRATQKQGKILSGEKLVDDPEFKDELMAKWPDAVGGEMEGAGIYAACEGSVNHWILAKGVCDFGDGTKNTNPNKDLFQKIAINSSVTLCRQVFSSKYGFDDLGLFSGALPEVEMSLTSKKKVEDFLSEQVIRQLNRQKASQKYIPETFVEVGKNKESLRYFCDPVGFLPKAMWEYGALDFQPLNQLLQKKGHGDFNFDLSEFHERAKTVQLSRFSEFFGRLQNYLIEKVEQLEKPAVASNAVSNFSYKLSRLEKVSRWLGKKVCLIKEEAGQGKTNFVCDLVDNFLLRREIPAVFLLGTDIDPKDIRKSILRKVYPDRSGYSFEAFLSEIEEYCGSVERPFVIIIDGLNENGSPRELSEKLEEFIGELSERDFVKVIITCRSEYYAKHFSNFDRSSFSPFMAETGGLTIFRNTAAADKIFIGYLRYFEIDLETYSTGVFEQVTENFLLLRILCDAYQGQHINYLGHIHKEALFRRYFEVKVAEITKRMEGDDELKVMGSINIKKFIAKLITYMVENRKYESIPFDNLLEEESNRPVYIRFLDENILVRRDLSVGSGIFEDQEVVSFTFDEFRDYLISDYLVSKIYPTDKKKFERFLKEEINPSSRILEGCGTFLYYISKKSGDAELLQIVEKQVWFDSIYLRCIFNLEDRYIVPADRQKIFSYMAKDRYTAGNIFLAMYYRNRKVENANLNLEHYLDHLRSLPKEVFDKEFLELFDDSKYSHHSINIESFVSKLEARLDREKGVNGSTDGQADIAVGIDGKDGFPHSQFEVLIYLFPHKLNWGAKRVYELYHHRYPAEAKIQLETARSSKNTSLAFSIEQFCRRYDILL